MIPTVAMMMAKRQGVLNVLTQSPPALPMGVSVDMIRTWPAGSHWGRDVSLPITDRSLPLLALGSWSHDKEATYTGLPTLPDHSLR